jgi:Fe-S cluster assembly protein SufD
MSAALAEKISEAHATARDALAPEVVSADDRVRALEALASNGLPSTRDENWKYANLRPLDRARLAPSSPRPRTDVSEADLPAAIGGYARFTFVDGIFVPELSSLDIMEGVSVSSLRSSRPDKEHLPTWNVRQADERLALLNDAFATDGAFVHVAEGVNCPSCVEILFIATEPAQTAASYPRLEMSIAPNARLGLIERHLSLHNDENFVNGAVRVHVSRDAQVCHYRLQQAGARATWFDTLIASVEQNARYELYLAQLGALSARSTMQIQLVGERAQLGLHAVSLADGLQVHDGFALVEHIAPYTKSEQRVRGIAAGRSRVAFNSKVVVRERARGADSQQSLRGLLAGTQAEIDVRPQLEIYTDDVRCNHGATAGKLDDTMLFYLLSRGIDRDTAQQLLKWAFLEDVVSRIAVPELRRHIEASLAGQMKETTAVKELI